MLFTLAAVQLPRWGLASSRPGIPAPNQRGHAWTGARVWEEPLWDRERARLCVPLPHFSSQGKNGRITLALAGFQQPDIILMDVASFICSLSSLLMSECTCWLVGWFLKNYKMIWVGAFLKSAFHCPFPSAVGSWSLSWSGQRWGAMCAGRGQCCHFPVN